MPRRPCIDCGTPTTPGQDRTARCPPCYRTRQHTRNLQRNHYRGAYKRKARAVRQTAHRNPDTLCWRCGKPAKPGDPWQAGHIRDGDPTSPLAPEHASCNAAAGATVRYR